MCPDWVWCQHIIAVILYRIHNANKVSAYCKKANIRDGFNFAVDDFSEKLKQPRSFYNTSVYSYLWLEARSYTIIREIKTTAKGPYQENWNFNTFYST